MQSGDILQAIINSSSDAIVTGDSDGLIITWNPAAERIFGHSAETAIGKPLSILMPERFRAAHDAGIARVVKTGKTKVVGQVLALTGFHASGREFPIELTLSTWEMDGERFFGGIIRDVTERAEMEASLSHSEERMRAVMQSANDAIVCADVDGRVIVWNAAAERILGYSAEEMTGASLTTFIP
jgi:PAS domain S-box-containing protein